MHSAPLDRRCRGWRYSSGLPTEAYAATRSKLHRLINGYQVSQALHVLTALGIPDRLADGPRSSQELAAVVGARESPLYRLLRAVAAIGVLEELPGRRFMLTELGEGLRSGVPGSLADWAAFIGRHTSFVIKIRIVPSDDVRRIFRETHGVRDAVEIQTDKPIPVEVLEMYVRRLVRDESAKLDRFVGKTNIINFLGPALTHP